jgi:hypothetical protein
MSATSGLDIGKIKQNVIQYWLEDTKMNWPVKVISAARGKTMGATSGGTLLVKGCVVSAKFVLGRPLSLAERILGLRLGELSQGAVLLRLTHLPAPADFDLAPGYTNVAAYPGYPPGLGSNQWILTSELPAVVVKIAAGNQTL